MRDRLRLEGELFVLALEAVIRVPLRPAGLRSDDLMVRSLRYGPLAGAIVGAFGALVLLGSSLLVPTAAAVLIAMIAMLLLTGAAEQRDTACAIDGLAAGRRRSDVMARMSLPGLDARGALALGCGLGLRWALLVGFVGEQGVGLAASALILGQALGHMARVHVKATTLAARREGMKARLFESTDDGYRVALAATLAMAGLTVMQAGPMAGLGAMLGAIAAGQIMRWIFVRRLGGYTREGLAAVQVMAELGAYLGLSMTS